MRMKPLLFVAVSLSLSLAAQADPTPVVSVTKDPLIVTSAGRERLCGYIEGDSKKQTVCFPDLSHVPYAQRATGEIKVTTGMFCTFGADGVHCFGSAYYVQLFAIPELRDVFDLALPPFAATGVNACALTGSASGSQAVCWGGNDAVREIPKTLIAPLKIVTSGLNACALDRDQYIKCWGDQDLGTSPYGVRNLKKLVMSNSAVCAIDAYGLMCWGPKGQIPTDLRGDGFIKDVTILDSQICTLTFENQVRCFGDAPFEVPELLKPIALSSLGQTVCATDIDGLKCWGRTSELPEEPPVRLPPAPRPGREIDP